MPFIPFAAAAGAALGTSATVGGLAVAAGAGFAVKSFMDSSKQAKQANQAAEDAARQNAAAIQGVKDSQSAASNNAQNQLIARARARSGSQTVFTNPLGISGQADTAKKKLLGE